MKAMVSGDEEGGRARVPSQRRIEVGRTIAEKTDCRPTGNGTGGSETRWTQRSDTWLGRGPADQTKKLERLMCPQ